ncbi:hypothetical protein HDV00_000085 [Rhizophlyctis rosea]|nr:hypothetical protein HDV00_000085 [Rhizophlyctis rosea]
MKGRSPGMHNGATCVPPWASEDCRHESMVLPPFSEPEVKGKELDRKEAIVDDAERGDADMGEVLVEGIAAHREVGAGILACEVEVAEVDLHMAFGVRAVAGDTLVGCVDVRMDGSVHSEGRSEVEVGAVG